MVKGRFKNPVEAVLVGVQELFRTKQNIRDINDNDRLDGKTCLITGANSGIGFAVAEEYAKRGANLIMACRSAIPEAGEKIKELTGSDTVEMMYVDLSDIDSIYALCDELKAKNIKLDIIVCNAGLAPPKARKTKLGLDEMFMVNYVAKYVFLNRLLKDGTIPNTIYPSTSPQSPHPSIPRIIITSSDSHRNASPIDWDKFGVFEPYGVKGSINRYSYFKLVLNTFATELSKRLMKDGKVDVAVYPMCPGAVNTNIIRDAPPLLKSFMRFIFSIFFQDPKKAARPYVYLAAGKEVEGQTNIYLHMMTQKLMDEKTYDENEGKRLWEETKQLLSSNEKGMKRE